MVARRRHRLDLLPLLDVFMVVLFVFATMQEQELDASVTRQSELREALEVTHRRLREAEASTVEADDPAQASARAQRAEQEAQAWQAKAEQAREAIEALREETATALEATAPGEDVVRREEVYQRLLDHFTVYEVEIAGTEGEAGVVNRCCYRVDVEREGWRECGEVPPSLEERTTWLDAGAGGLAEVLRKTKGGNALTIVRQDEIATYRIAAKLGELLRERFDGHEIYAGTTAPTEIECPAR
jgi:biopolymer transport protein ExbD